LAFEFPTAQRWVYDPKAAAMSFQQAQWGAQPWNGQSADLIVAGSVFTHLHMDVARAELRRLCELLTPGGALLVTLHDFVPATRTYATTEESALPELEDQLKPESYASVYFSKEDWAQLIPRGYQSTLRPERFGGTQQIMQIQRAEPEA
jgi:trans-aconitate methyltransferase